MNAPSLPTPAEIPCPVARMSTGNNSLGMMRQRPADLEMNAR
jgi:hypothetical protein